MGLSICPAATVAAPIEDVWELLSQPTRYDEWWDAHTERIVPEGPATPGQVVYAKTREFGRDWHVSFVVKEVNPDRHQIALDMTLPLGIVNHETISCTPIDATSCRVQYG